MGIDNVKVRRTPAPAIVPADYHTKGLYGGKPYEHFGRFKRTPGVPGW